MLRTVAAVGLALLLCVSCAEKKEFTASNLPPETYVAISGSVRNPTSYIQTLHWWGEDVDGEVIGYEYRWWLDTLETHGEQDTNWTFTSQTQGTFELPVTKGVSTHRFEVRAIDDDMDPDPTPASVTLPMKNLPPEVMIWDVDDLPDTTFPAILVKWHAEDPDGEGTIASYLVWLDGQREDARSFSAQDTVGSLAFEDFQGRYGTRTLYLVAVDSGHDTSDAATFTWYVREPEGSILLVDDLSSDVGAAEARTDRFYRSSIDSCGEVYSVLDLEGFGGETYAHNFSKLFEQFDLVIWYTDPVKTASPHLTLAEEAIYQYIQSGGKFLLISLGAVGTNSSFSDSAAFEVFGIDSLYMNGETTNFDCKRWIIKGNSSLGLDSLRVEIPFGGVECMKPAATSTPLFYIPPKTANQHQDVNYYLGLLKEWGTGKATLITFPLSRSNLYRNATTEFCKIVALMLE